MRSPSGLVCSIALLAFGAAGPARAASPLTKDGYLKAGFDLLGSFEFTAPNDTGAPAPPAAIAAAMAQVPPRIQELDGRKVMVTGYMLPLKLTGNRVSEFLLVSSPMICCYGTIPQMNNWIIVRMTGAGAPILMDSPIQFFGRLHVGKVVEDGVLAGIYLLDGEKMGDGQD